MSKESRESRADERQVGGSHYTEMEVQPWTANRAWLTDEQWKGYLLGQAIAYLARYNATGAEKGGMKDVMKARHYLDKFIEDFGTKEDRDA